MTSPLLPAQRRRQFYLDAARFFAVICISLNHAVNRSYDNYYYQQYEFETIAVWDSAFKAVITVLSHLGVPTFLMISGALLMNKRMETTEDLKRFYRHNLLGLLITTEIWYFIIYFFMIFLDPSVQNGTPLLSGLLQTMLFQNQTTMASMWYMPMILCIYTTLPFVIAAKDKFGLKGIVLPFAVLFVSCMVIPALNAWQEAHGSWTLHSALWEKYLLPVYYLYILAGFAVSQGLLSKLKTLTVALLSAGCFVLTCGYQLYMYSTPINHLLMESSPSIFTTAILVFELFRRIAPHLSRWAKFITYHAKIAFGIYFVHILIMSAMHWYLDLSAMARPLRVLLYETVSFGGSVAIIWLLSKNPLCKKYLFLIKD